MNRLIRLVTILVSFNSFGQYGYYKDVIKFGQYFNGGTGRVQAIGGASSSLGGDVSSISFNPAGIGFFNKKVFSITYKSQSNKNTSNFISDNILQ